MGKVITLSGLRGTETPEIPAVGGDCASRHAETLIIDGVEYCRDLTTGKIYNKETMEEYVDPADAPKLLNYGIAMGMGALVGIMVGASMKKGKGVKALAGAGVGAVAGAALLAMVWPKRKLPPTEA